MDCPNYHIPVMLNECIRGLNIKPDGIYLDLTYGGGGHSKEILNRLKVGGHLYGFDQDNDAKEGAIKDERFTFVHSNFSFLKNLPSALSFIICIPLKYASFDFASIKRLSQ